eukprot:m.14658 g.14658  ORF g.14658 m.14658 type:complete len:1077 (-) comp3182_c0_seq1:53-3283(-)
MEAADTGPVAVKSPKVLKREEKARLAAEKKARKEAEKAARKAEKARLAAEKKAARAAKKKGKQSEPQDATSGESNGVEGSASALSSSVASDTTTTSSALTGRSTTADSTVHALPHANGSASGRPSVLDTLHANGIGRVAQAWISGHPAVELGLTAHNVCPDALIDTNFSNLGEGVFGMVYACEIARDSVSQRLRDGHTTGNAAVVVKKLASDVSAEVAADFAAEAAVMEKLDHPNVLRLVASDMEGSPRIMVYEGHGHGMLVMYLHACKTTGQLSSLQQARMGRDVAAGLAYLHSVGAVHRDLAARNCLVTEDDVVRIGDFGLSHVRFPGDYHTVDGIQLPVRWMAPEVFGERIFTAESDVWSAGVVLWEIATHGSHPFPKLASGEVADAVLQGTCNLAPADCNPGLADAMAACQHTNALERPTASALASTLEALVDDLTLAAANGQGAEADDAVGELQSAGGSNNGTFDKLKKTKRSFRSLGQFKDAENPSAALASAASKTSAVELSRDRITLGSELGQGAFGVVVRGKLVLDSGDTVVCACKTLKDRRHLEDLDALEAEAELVSQFNHDNVVKCFGKVTSGDPAMIVFEFMSNGSLFAYLHGLHEVPKLQRLMKIAIDIAAGMEYLAAGNNVHRDLATRNVLVNEELTCKISDFGLSRDLDDDTYYESDGGMVPIRWTPPEAYKYKKYSTASDVWSYGITLYEVWTKGGLPYGRKWTNMNVMMEVEKGYRLSAPPKCPKAVYQLMLRCWSPLRRMRPSFPSIREQLQMAHDMMFPPEEDADDADVEVDTEYGDMDQMYYGMDVPTEDNLDTYLDNPTPLASPEKAAAAAGTTTTTTTTASAAAAARLASELEARKPTHSSEIAADLTRAAPPLSASSLATPHGSRADTTPQASPRSTLGRLSSQDGSDGAQTYVGKDIENKPDRFAHLLKGGAPIPAVPGNAGGNPASSSNNRRHSEGQQPTTPPVVRRVGQGSLRKQRAASDLPDEANDSGVDFSKKNVVADMINLSKAKEELSAAELAGIAKLQKAGALTPAVQPNAYMETVGRAVEQVTEVKVGKRKRCVCRRFKCVCGAK